MRKRTVRVSSDPAQMPALPRAVVAVLGELLCFLDLGFPTFKVGRLGKLFGSSFTFELL